MQGMRLDAKARGYCVANEGRVKPNAGRTRTDNEERHPVSGKWSGRMVLTLIRNAAIIGLNRYGVQSEGSHRRLED